MSFLWWHSRSSGRVVYTYLHKNNKIILSKQISSGPQSDEDISKEAAQCKQVHVHLFDRVIPNFSVSFISFDDDFFFE